jgi:hypothetical protein
MAPDLGTGNAKVVIKSPSSTKFQADAERVAVVAGFLRVIPV